LSDPKISRRTLLGGSAAIGLGAMAPAMAPASTYAGENAIDQRSIDHLAARLNRDLVLLRRDIHRHPEIAGAERRTAAAVADRLRRAGLAVTTGVGGHGVVGVLRGARPGRTVAYRADMDAVTPDSQFPSGTENAHVCGHDLHTTIGVGIAQVLARLRHRLSGRLVFFFQPGEENLTGASAMIDDGLLERHRPAEIHAIHCGPFAAGEFGVMPGSGLPGLDRGVITVDAGADRLAASINALSTVSFPEQPSDFDRLVQDILTPNGPLARFVSARARVAAGQVQVSYRCWPEERYVEVRRTIEQLAAPYAGAQVSFPDEPFPAMVVPVPDGTAVGQHLRGVFGADAVKTVYAPVPYNGEDFALFLRRMPGTFTFLGVRSPDAPLVTSYPHLTTFDPDERAIGIGVRAMAGWLARRTWD
jgi:metal-dependent amidase/aminoacylase/carboxypeptidase family protein